MSPVKAAAMVPTPPGRGNGKLGSALCLRRSCIMGSISAFPIYFISSFCITLITSTMHIYCGKNSNSVWSIESKIQTPSLEPLPCSRTPCLEIIGVKGSFPSCLWLFTNPGCPGSVRAGALWNLPGICNRSSLNVGWIKYFHLHKWDRFEHIFLLPAVFIQQGAFACRLCSSASLSFLPHYFFNCLVQLT